MKQAIHPGQKQNPGNMSATLALAAMAQAEHEQRQKWLKQNGLEVAGMNFDLPGWAAADKQLANTQLGGGQERVNFYIYDTYTLAVNTAAVKQTLFLIPIQGSTKVLSQTNMVSMGMLTGSQVLVAKALRVYVQNNVTPTDLIAFYANTSVVVKIGKKPMIEGVPWMFPAGGGLWFSGAQVGTAPAGSAVAYSSSNGVPDVRNVYSMSDPLTINAGEQFQVEFTPETAWTSQANTTNPAGTGLTVVFAFEGILFREVR